MKRLIILFMVCMAAWAIPVHAAGPADIARSDRSLWPYAVDTDLQFDLASRHEILAFVDALDTHAKDGADELKIFLQIKSVNEVSLLHWQQQAQQRLLLNYRAASAGCQATDPLCKPLDDYAGLRERAQMAFSALPDNMKPWYDNARLFYTRYVYELMRLAALFPNITSEIDTFGPSEVTGGDWPDRQFLLSFDDGPHTPNGNTDKTLAVLDSNGKHAVFFMLGERVKARLAKQDSASLAAPYSHQCVASHGMEHQSHAKWSEWETSLKNSQTLLMDTFGKKSESWFRPPYGQRLPESQGKYYAKTVLWNIDSQDWNNSISAAQVSDRVLSLMLLWRRGIVLFHDIHPKAAVALPVLWQRIEHTHVQWLDCQMASELMM